jgi:hypothetical protein
MRLSPQRRNEIIDALRRGTVPQRCLDTFAVGLEAFEPAIEEELEKVRAGGSQFKAIRGEYGCGKTFFARWLADKARKCGFATSEVQISEMETPLHRLETIYRRLNEHLALNESPEGAFRNIIDGWFYNLEEDILAEGNMDPSHTEDLIARTNELMEKRLQNITRTSPTFSAALRGYRKAQANGDQAVADGILAWLAGQPNIGAGIKRVAGVKGDVDHYGAMSFLQGLVTILRDSGHAGLLLIIDEVETLQRVRSDVRDKGLNALRQLIDEVDSGRFPGVYLLITGTPSFFDGPQGVRRLEPLAQRLHVDFTMNAKFDNPRAVQIRLPAFDLGRLCLVGKKVREIYCEYSQAPERINHLCDDPYINELAEAVSGKLGGKVGIAPRIFLKKLVADILDRLDQFEEFRPREHYTLTIIEAELTTVERQAAGAADIDEIELNM